MDDVLGPYRHRELSLPELVQAAAGLCVRLPAPADERVRAEPDDRTVRYYQSTGLVDRPVRHDGRNAVYGYRHLLQVVAVKALQGAGRSLAQVQAGLAGVPTSRLEAAVAEALGVSPAAPTPEAPPVAAAPAAMLTFAVADGVWLTVDPARVADPAALAALVRTLTPRSSP